MDTSIQIGQGEFRAGCSGQSISNYKLTRVFPPVIKGFAKKPVVGQSLQSRDEKMAIWLGTL
jgi:hypothetical protein